MTYRARAALLNERYTRARDDAARLRAREDWMAFEEVHQRAETVVPGERRELENATVSRLREVLTTAQRRRIPAPPRLEPPPPEGYITPRQPPEADDEED